MLKRKYRFVKLDYGSVLVVEFFDSSLEALSDFIFTEVTQFSNIILMGIENVLFNRIEEYNFSGNMLDIECNRYSVIVSHQMDDIHDEVGPSILSTNDFYKLVKEFLYFEKLLNEGVESIFPLEMNDGDWIIE